MNAEIPRLIHYCWFGKGPKPKLAEECIASWKKFLPDYEIREWNEDNYDVNVIPYTAEAYEAKKYAFVSDYARFDILYRHGGIYFDTDVEVVRGMDDVIARGAFMGLERDPEFGLDCKLPPDEASHRSAANPGLGLGCAPGLGLYKAILDNYSRLHFTCGENPQTVVDIVTNLLLAHGLQVKPGIMQFEGISIYPREYFNPLCDDGKIRITPNTISIHHYAASWYSPKKKFLKWIDATFGRCAYKCAALLMHNPFYIVMRVNRYLRTGK